MKLWFLMAAAGMVLGVGIAVLKRLLFPTVFDARSVENNFKLKVIGEIPNSKKVFAQKKPLTEIETDSAAGAVRERFLTLAHILRHRMENEKPACLCVTSALPNEGKTSVLANLGLQLAAIECRVLMVDLDVHHPNLAKMFIENVDYYHSINAVYRRESSAENAVVHVKACLDLLPVFLEATPIGLNDDLLSVVRELSANYDIVLIDTPTVGRSADTLLLNKIVNAALFVIRQDSTPVSEVNAALERMKESGISIAGVVLNAVNHVRELSYINNAGKGQA